MKKLILEYQSSKQKSSCHLAEGNSSKLNEVGIKPDWFKSYTVCLAAVICNIIVCGYSYSFGLLLPPLLDHFKEDTATTGKIHNLSTSFLHLFYLLFTLLNINCGVPWLL